MPGYMPEPLAVIAAVNALIVVVANTAFQRNLMRSPASVEVAARSVLVGLLALGCIVLSQTYFWSTFA